MSVGFDLTITLSAIVEVVIFGGGGIATLVTLRNAVASLKENQAETKKETKLQFDSVQLELKKLGEVLIGMARFDEKLTNLDKRVTTQGRKIDELARGNGYVQGKRDSIDGEYP
jgi:hypothetical protein